LFAWPSTLVEVFSTEKLAVTLPSLKAVVSATRTLLYVPDAPWQPTDVSDAHAVCSQAVAPALRAALCVSRPRLPPDTVTLADPLAPMLRRRSALTPPALIEKIRDALPPLSPTVALTFRLPIPPCPNWHRKDESDSQLVRSQIVDPILTEPEDAVRPIPIPCKVTLIDPEAAVFMRLRLLINVLDADSTWLMLPTLTPELTTTILLLSPITAAPHRTDVSESHALLSHDDGSRRLDMVYAAGPIRNPHNVMLADAVERTLL